MRIFSNLAPLLALAVSAAPAAAQAEDGPLVMAPSSPWVADFADDSCALRRSFQVGEDKAILELRQFTPGDNADILVVSETMTTSDGPVRVRFEPDDDWYSAVAMRRVSGGGLQGVSFTDSLRANAEREQSRWSEQDRSAREVAISDFSVDGAFERPVTLHTGSMHAPMETLRSCMDDLLVSWGLDPVAQRTLARNVIPVDQMSWQRKVLNAYPTAAVASGQDGRVALRMIVGPDGRPTACVPHKGHSAPIFEQSACDTMMRYSKFEPALDANGTAVAGIFHHDRVFHPALPLSERATPGQLSCSPARSAPAALRRPGLSSAA